MAKATKPICRQCMGNAQYIKELERCVDKLVKQLNSASTVIERVTEAVEAGRAAAQVKGR